MIYIVTDVTMTRTVCQTMHADDLEKIVINTYDTAHSSLLAYDFIRHNFLQISVIKFNFERYYPP